MRRILFFIVLNLFFGQTFAHIQTFKLENGLKLLIKEDHRAPIVVSMIWYDVGSVDEHDGSTGLAHALEHMMFKGTKKHPAGNFSNLIAAMGGQFNAFTYNDYTVYYEKVAANHLETCFALEADRMQNLLLDKNEFKQEIKVIQEERRLRVDDNPQSLTSEQLTAATFLVSPYRHPVIGWQNDLQQMTIHDIKHWYKKYYTPSNANIIVVGDVNPYAVRELAVKYFGNIPSKPVLKRKNYIEPKVLGQKNIEVHAPAKVPMLMLSYITPTLNTAKKENSYEPYALAIISNLLSADESSRFNKQLIRGKELAASVDTFYNPFDRFQTQFLIYGLPREQHTLEELKKNILYELKQLKTLGIQEAELKRIKTQLIAQKTYEKDSIFAQAMELGILENLGLSWQVSAKFVERINQVTTAQIQRTAQRYFQDQVIAEARLLPSIGVE